MEKLSSSLFFLYVMFTKSLLNSCAFVAYTKSLIKIKILKRLQIFVFCGWQVCTPHIVSPPPGVEALPATEVLFYLGTGWPQWKSWIHEAAG